MALSAIALGAGLAREAEARTLLISFCLVDSTIQAAMRIAAGASLAEVASTSVASLTQGVLKAMLFTKTKGVLLGLATAAVITTGVGVLAQQSTSPDGDRLGVLERKLDQILEAVGGSGQAARESGGFDPLRFPDVKGAPPAADQAGRPASGRDRFAVRKTSEWVPEKKAPRMPTPEKADTTGTHRPSWPRFANDVEFPGGPPDTLGLSRAIAARMDSFEQRLAELERRINQLERRNSGESIRKE